MRKIAVLAVVFCISVSAFAALTPGQKLAVEALIKQFTSAEFDQRQKAVDRLVEMGPDVVPVVKDALAKTLDAEVKLRCEMVLKALGAAEAAAAPKDKFGFGPSRITLDVKDMPLADVVEKLAEQSGNKPIKVPEALKDKTVTLSVKDADYWVAVEALCDQLNLLVMPSWSPAGNTDGAAARFQFYEAEKNPKLTAFSGPVVVKPDSCTQTMLYRQMRLTGPATGWRSGGTQLGISYYHEDRIECLTSSIELGAVLAPDGKNYLPADGPARGPWGGNAMMPGGQSWPWGSATFMLPDVPGDLRKLSEISGVVRLEFGSGEREVRIDDVQNAVGKEMKFDDWTIAVTKAEKLQGAMQVRVEASFKGQPTPIPSWMTAAGYGWYVVGGEDHPQKVRGYSYGGGGVWVMRGGGDVGIARGGMAAPRKSEFSVIFQGKYEAGPYALLLKLPTTHETKEYPFTLKDVPLP